MMSCISYQAFETFVGRRFTLMVQIKTEASIGEYPPTNLIGGKYSSAILVECPAGK